MERSGRADDEKEALKQWPLDKAFNTAGSPRLRNHGCPDSMDQWEPAVPRFWYQASQNSVGGPAAHLAAGCTAISPGHRRGDSDGAPAGRSDILLELPHQLTRAALEGSRLNNYTADIHMARDLRARGTTGDDDDEKTTEILWVGLCRGRGVNAARPSPCSKTPFPKLRNQTVRTTALFRPWTRSNCRPRVCRGLRPNFAKILHPPTKATTGGGIPSAQSAADSLASYKR